jgi:hypothetical protein
MGIESLSSEYRSDRGYDSICNLGGWTSGGVQFVLKFECPLDNIFNTVWRGCINFSSNALSWQTLWSSATRFCVVIETNTRCRSRARFEVNTAACYAVVTVQKERIARLWKWWRYSPLKRQDSVRSQKIGSFINIAVIIYQALVLLICSLISPAKERIDLFPS